MGSSPRAALRTGTRHCPSCRARRHESGDRQEALRVRSQVDMYRAELELQTPAELVMFVLANGELVRMPAETPGRASSCCIPPGYRPGTSTGANTRTGCQR